MPGIKLYLSRLPTVLHTKILSFGKFHKRILYILMIFGIQWFFKQIKKLRFGFGRVYNYFFLVSFRILSFPSFSIRLFFLFFTMTVIIISIFIRIRWIDAVKANSDRSKSLGEKYVEQFKLLLTTLLLFLSFIFIFLFLIVFVICMRISAMRW